MADSVIDIFMNFKANGAEVIDNLTAKAEGLSGKFKNIGNALLPISGIAAVALGGSVKMAADFQKALDGAQRGLDLTDTEMKQFSQTTQQLSRDLNNQFSSTELAKIETEAGKLGIAKNDVDDFAKVIAKLAVATDQTKNMGELSTNASKVSTIFKMGIPDLENWGASVNKLDDATSATSNQIIEFTQRSGKMASGTNINAQTLSAYGATLISAGEHTASAATFMNKFIGVLGNATTLSKGAQGALQKLGFDAKGLAVAFDKDATGTMQKFLLKVNELDSVSRREILANIFGQEHVDSASLLAGQAQNLANNLKAAGDTTGNITKLNTEFNKMSTSLAGQAATVKNLLGEIGISIGAILLPGIAGIATAIAPVLQQFALLAQTNPMISTMIVGFLGIAAAAAPVAFIISGIVTAVTAISSAWVAFSAVAIPAITTVMFVVQAFGGYILYGLIPVIGTFISAAVTGFASIAAAVFAAVLPFAPLIAAALAVSAAAYLIITNWSSVSAFFSGMWASIVAMFSSAIASIISMASNLAASVSGFFTGMFDSGIAALQSFLLALVGGNQTAFAAALYIGESINLGISRGLQGIAALVQGLVLLPIQNVFNAAKNYIANSVNEWGIVIRAFSGLVGAIFRNIGTQITSSIASWVASIRNFASSVSAVFNQIGSSIRTAVSGWIAAIRSFISSVAAVFAQIGSIISSAVSSWISSVRGFVNQVGSVFLGLVAQASSWGSGLVNGFVSGFQSAAAGAISSVAGFVQKVRSYLPSSPAKVGALSDLDKSGIAFADTFIGGVNQGGLQSFLDGILSTPTSNMTGQNSLIPVSGVNGGGGTIQINYSPNIYGSKMDAQTILNILKSDERRLLQTISDATAKTNRKTY